MLKSPDFYKVEIPVIRKKYNKTNSAKFKGKIKFFCSEFGIIYKWYLELDEVYIDTYTTKGNLLPKKGKKRPKIYLERTDILIRLKLKEEPRPNSSRHNLIKLNSEELKKLNLFFKEEYNSTLKNTLVILKGNNPGGEASKPCSAEMITTSNMYNNIVILFDALNIKDTNIDTCNNLTYIEPALCEEEFVNILKRNHKLKFVWENLQKNKTYEQYKQIMQQLKKYIRKYKVNLVKIDKMIKNCRSVYSKNIDNNISEYPSYVIDGKHLKSYFEKAHIWNVKQIRTKIIKDVSKGRSLNETINDYKKYIIDVFNYVPLPGSLHRMFDKNQITYNEKTGEMIIIDAEIEAYIELKYKEINKDFFEPRAHYFKKRNKELNFK